MRTKNAKRLWPVPATLTVVAVVAFLAFGLMATTGVQPAAAQSSADCDVMVVIAADGVTTPTVDDKFDADPEDCQAKGDTATVKFTGPATLTDGVDDPGKLDLLIQDDNGPIRAYLNNYVDYDVGGSEYQITGTGESAGLGTAGDEAPAAMRFRIQEIEVPLAARDSQGQYSAQSVTVTVSGNVYIYESGDTLTDVIAAVPEDSSDKRNEIAVTQNDVVIVFLGAPALGKDSDNDINKILDDEEQCLNSAGEAMELPATGTCTGDFGTGDGSDTAESKSKLVATGGDSPAAVIDGKSKDHKLTTQTSATIYAVVEDAKGQALPGTEVNFTATIEPSDLELDFDTDRDVDAETVITSGTAESGEVFFTDDDLPTGILAGDAIASREITGLPTGDAAYRITVNVTAGSLDLGSVVVTRVGPPTIIKAGVFNMECLAGGPDEDSYTDDTADLTDDDCDDSGMARRFGAGEVFFVKTHLEDSLGSVVDGNLDIELEEMDNPLDKDGGDELIMAVSGRSEPAAWVYKVDPKAELGDHMITVSTDVLRMLIKRTSPPSR